MLTKLKNLFLLLGSVGGIILFVLLAPFLIWAVLMLVLGAICFFILGLIVYGIMEVIKEK